jgi:hypothetical protein
MGEGEIILILRVDTWSNCMPSGVPRIIFEENRILSILRLAISCLTTLKLCGGFSYLHHAGRPYAVFLSIKGLEGLTKTIGSLVPSWRSPLLKPLASPSSSLELIEQSLKASEEASDRAVFLSTTSRSLYSFHKVKFSARMPHLLYRPNTESNAP